MAENQVERIRGRKLQRIRHAYFSQHPLCAMCEAQGRVRAATELDHIVALTNGGTNDWSNYQGLCGPCHEVKTNADLGYKPKQTIGLDGYPVESTQEQSSAARWRRAEAGRPIGPKKV